MPDKEFEELFEEASKEGGQEDSTKTTDKKVDGKTEEETQAEKDAALKKQTEGDNKPTYEEVEQKYKSLQGMIESQQREKDELAKKAKELEDKLFAIDEARGGKPKPEAQPEDAELTEYLKDYAYISGNEAKLRKKELEQLKKDVIEEISKTYEVPIKSVEKIVAENDEVKAAIHLGSIKEAHEDYGEAFKKEDVVKWVETLSPARKKANMAIIEEGDTEEVIDLITSYKEANNIPITKEESSSDEVKTKIKKDERLESLEVVKGKKSPVTGGGSKKVEDYEGAFAEAAAVK